MPSVFFICLRETLETSIIVSILLTFLKQTLGPDRDAVTYKKLVRQVSVDRSIPISIPIVFRCGGEPVWDWLCVSLLVPA